MTYVYIPPPHISENAGCLSFLIALFVAIQVIGAVCSVLVYEKGKSCFDLKPKNVAGVIIYPGIVAGCFLGEGLAKEF